MHLRSIRARLTRSFGASVAEVGHQDLWQRADLLCAIAASDVRVLERELDAAEAYLRSQEWDVVSAVREVYEVDA